MNQIIKKLFEQYCQSNYLFLKTKEEVEKSVFLFSDSLKHDLTRAFYLGELTDIPIEFPDLYNKIQNLLTKVPSLSDPRLIAIRDKKNQIGEEISKILESSRKFYEISKLESLQALYNNHTPQNILILVQTLDFNDLENKITSAESYADAFDKIYLTYLKNLLTPLKRIQKYPDSTRVKPESINDYPELNQLIKREISLIIPTLYRLLRRGEVGLELLDLCYKQKFSFLCYMEISGKKR